MKVGEKVRKFLERKRSLKMVFEYLSEIYAGSPDGSVGVYYVLGLMELKDKLELCRKHGVDCTELNDKVKAIEEFKNIVVDASNNETVGVLVDELHRMNAIAESFIFFANREVGGIEKIKDEEFQSVVEKFVQSFKKEGLDVEKEICHLCGIKLGNGNKPKF